jgi:hypothetical protein
MEVVKIILFCVLAAITYGMVHDQFTARICIEYFTIGHPPVFHTTSPTLLGIGWGIIATWWVGLFLGVPLALVARCGSRTQLTVKQLMRPVLMLLCVMACMAMVAGFFGYFLAIRGVIKLPEFLASAIPTGHHVGFMADWWAHSASYLGGFVGGLVLIILSWFRRRAQIV